MDGKGQMDNKSMGDVGISAHLLEKQCDIRSFFVASERSLHDLNDTLWSAIYVIQALEFDFIFKKIECHLCYFLMNLVIFICFSTYFFFYHIMHESSKCDIIKYVTPCTIKVMY